MRHAWKIHTHMHTRTVSSSKAPRGGMADVTTALMSSPEWVTLSPGERSGVTMEMRRRTVWVTVSCRCVWRGINNTSFFVFYSFTVANAHISRVLKQPYATIIPSHCQFSLTTSHLSGECISYRSGSEWDSAWIRGVHILVILLTKGIHSPSVGELIIP